MRPQSDALTSREREVLDLIRVGLTNEEIATRRRDRDSSRYQRFGAKYHVSQILSKLGVTTREEAASVVLAAWRPWWLRAAVWARIAGAATVAAAVAGLAVLVFLMNGEAQEDAEAPGVTSADGATVNGVIGTYKDDKTSGHSQRGSRGPWKIATWSSSQTT